MHNIISNVRPECQQKKRVVCPLLDVLDATTMGYKLILEKTEGSIQRDTGNIGCKTQNRQIKQNTQRRKQKNEQHELHKNKLEETRVLTNS
jgi:SHS2 domain-containing protein